MTTLTKTNETTVIAPLAEAEMAALEQQIRTDIKAFQRVGLALIRIRDGRGYRLRGFKTFEAYCERVWDFTDRHGRRLIAAAETAEKVKAAVGVEPSSESVARVLAPVANDPIVLQRVAEKLQMKQATIANASAEKVAEVVAAVTGKPRPAKKDDKPRHTRPATNGKPAPAPAPAVGADDATTLQAILTSARSFLANHPWLADDDAARRLVGQLDQAGHASSTAMLATRS